MADVMAAIATCQAMLVAKIEAGQMDVGLLRQDMTKLHSRVRETEQQVSHMEDEVIENTAAIHTLQTKFKALEYRTEDAKNRNRRNNLRIMGLAEGAEGGNPMSFVEDMLRSILPDAHLSPHYAVERAHQVLPKPRPPGALSQTLILRLLNFHDRDEILRASRINRDLRFQNKKLLIFPDYLVETQKLRKSFDQVKSVMWAQNIQYSVLFLARLWVQDGESAQFFNSPREASAWLDTLPPVR